jgi:hypothetical protein
VLAWLRRIIVSLGIGGASYAIMLAIMVLSVVYDQQFEPVITFAFDTGRWITDVLDSWVSGSRWGQVAVNHLRERVNMTHVVLSIPAIILATIFVGIPLNKFLGGSPLSAATCCNGGSERAHHSHSCRGALHLQCTCARHLRSASTIRRLDLAGVIKCTERLWGHHTRRSKTHECREARFLGASLRNHGPVQYPRSVPGEHALCISH